MAPDPDRMMITRRTRAIAAARPVGSGPVGLFLDLEMCIAVSGQ